MERLKGRICGLSIPIGCISKPYRAPELLFGTTSYLARAVDSWSLGVLLAEFFTALRLTSEDDNELPPEPHSPGAKPFVLPEGGSFADPHAVWKRDSLFDASRGEIGLAWSIFCVRGTPTEETWPGFTSLPDASRVTFTQTPGVPLSPLLPNLPTPSTTPLDMIEKFLQYPPDKRLSPADALKHDWFKAAHAETVLLPPGYADSARDKSAATVAGEWEGQSLGQLMRSYVRPHLAQLSHC